MAIKTMGNTAHLSRLLTLLLLVQFVVARSYHDFPRTAFQQNKAVDDIEDFGYWMNLGRSDLDQSLLETTHNTKVAKNVILFIGDGMSIPTLTAARIYKAQQFQGDFERPEKEYLTFERLHHTAHSKTYSINMQTADSAATASAMYSGVKTKSSTMGYDSKIDSLDVNSSFTATKVTSIMTWAQEAGMDTGLVSTARITHATPAALYAHSYDRNWECDNKYAGGIPGLEPPAGLHDIAWQLVREAPGNASKVIIGGGSSAFFPKAEKDLLKEKHSPATKAWDECLRSDGLNLANEWLADHGPRATLAMNRVELMAVDPAQTDYLFGMMSASHMSYDDSRDLVLEPSIAEMTEKAIEILKKNDNGFFLMVESGRVDHAHHNTQANRALSETVALDLAVEKALEMMADQMDETLLIVTADHAHTMSISGYSFRGHDIRGLSSIPYMDLLPYTTLSYANGPGYYEHNIVSDLNTVTRRDLAPEAEQAKDYSFVHTSTGYESSETHGGDDVAIFARGPMSHLFHSTHEQTFIAHVMAYAACLGPYAQEPGRCQTSK